MNAIGYEIDYLAVGEGERSGDAICLRYGDLHGTRDQQTIITIDGGTAESGKKLVEHVKNYYGTDKVDIAILSHPDADHASGMRQVIEGLTVSQVAMHRPWLHSGDVSDLIDHPDATATSIRAKTKRNLSVAREIEQLAIEKGIPIVEPFAGQKNQNGLVVLGPTKEFYQETLAAFDFMPGAGEIGAPRSIAEGLRALASSVVHWITENWFTETLGEPAEDATSPENNSSVIFLLTLDGKRLLFTGDAGVRALTSALDFAEQHSISLAGVSFFHVPHHGSRRNLGPTILNRLFGSPRANDTQDWTACVSSAKDGAPKHPHKKVTNALRRRGARVHVTGGRNICHTHLAPVRPGWVAITPLPLYTEVEDDE
jgi:beta-lactamase superfamily II metal-dependent hydrolase